MTDKIWKGGPANVWWKIMICALDAHRAQVCMATLSTILLDGNPTIEEADRRISAMTGADVVRKVREYEQSALQTVVNALAKPPELDGYVNEGVQSN